MQKHFLLWQIILSVLVLEIAQPLPSFATNKGEQNLPTATELNRLSRDLIPLQSSDFFNQGRQQLEQFIQQFQQEEFLPEEPVLKILPSPSLENEQSSSFNPKKINQ